MIFRCETISKLKPGSILHGPWPFWNGPPAFSAPGEGAPGGHGGHGSHGRAGTGADLESPGPVVLKVAGPVVFGKLANVGKTINNPQENQHFYRWYK